MNRILDRVCHFKVKILPACKIFTGKQGFKRENPACLLNSNRKTGFQKGKRGLSSKTIKITRNSSIGIKFSDRLIQILRKNFLSCFLLTGPVSCKNFLSCFPVQNSGLKFSCPVFLYGFSAQGKKSCSCPCSC